ncbi:uncharacterized protein LOC135821389 isoform X1 [Sycon ciliatum]|uniref:uncharacterized protein LOC135821389 isoform X1 n=1 Tax=Sycon ciliatum TaxID=27933 RepID=UPI0031F6CE03
MYPISSSKNLAQARLRNMSSRSPTSTSDHVQVHHAASASVDYPVAGPLMATSSPTQSSPRRSSLPDAVVRFAEMLKKRYVGAKVLLGKGMCAKPNRRALDKMFVNVVIIPREDLASLNEQTFFGSQSDVQKLSHVFSRVADKVQHVQLANMFDFDGEDIDEDESVRVLAVACAGAGKTTIFVLKGPLDWARGLMWHEFDIVSALALRDASVRHARNVVDLLQLERYGIVDVEEQKEIASFVHANLKHVCVILDGLDETVLGDCSDFVRGIIRGEELKGIRLLLTSRHSAEVMKLSVSCPFDRRVEVLGFTKGNVLEYVNNALPCTEASRLLEKVDADPSLSAIMQTPYFTQSTCDVFRSCGSVPSSLFGIFMSLILSMIRQNTESAYPDWVSVPRLLQEQILELGHFAFVSIMKKKVVFSDSDLDAEQVSRESRSLGVLVACESLSYPSITQWQFSHLSVQECLASLYMASTNPDASDVEYLVRQVGALTGHLSTFWCLLASQLTAVSRESLIASILTQRIPDKEDVNKLTSCCDVTKFLRCSEDDLLEVVELLCEHLDEAAVQSLARCLLKDLLPDNVSVAQAIEEVLPHSFSSSLYDVVHALLQLWRRKVPRASMRILCTALKSINPHASNCLHQYFASERTEDSQAAERLSSAAMDCSVHSVMSVPPRVSYSPADVIREQLTPVRRLLLLLACRVYAQPSADTDNMTSCSQSPSPRLELAFEYYGFDFTNVAISPADCHHLSSVLRNHSRSVSRVRLRNCQITDDGFEQLTIGLTHCHGLVVFSIPNNALTDCSVACIHSVICENHTALRQLTLRDLQLTSSGYAQLVPAVITCHDLEILSIGSVSCQDIKTNVLIALTVLADCKSLTYPRFYFPIGDDGLVLLSGLLTARPFSGMSLARAVLTPHSTWVVKHVLRVHCRNLQFLELRDNDLSDMFLCSIAPCLKQCKSLVTLAVSGTGLTSQSLPVLADILSSCPDLQIVFLHGNDFQAENDEGSRQFASAVHECQNLLYLSVPKPELVNDQLWRLLDYVHRERAGQLRIDC